MMGVSWYQCWRLIGAAAAAAALARKYRSNAFLEIEKVGFVSPLTEFISIFHCSDQIYLETRNTGRSQISN